jgi:hypothetical protein
LKSMPNYIILIIKNFQVLFYFSIYSENCAIYKEIIFKKFNENNF